MKEQTPYTAAFEGLDGAGKSTVIQSLSTELEERGLRVAVVTNPSHGWMGKILRAHLGDMDPDKKNVLFPYDIVRTQRSIPTSMDVVFWDRHLDSVIVSNTDDAKDQILANSGNITLPGHVFYIDISPEVSWEREGANSDHPLDAEWIADKYRRYVSRIIEDPERFEIVDGAQSKEDVLDTLMSRIYPEVEAVALDRAHMYDVLFQTPGIVRFLIEEPAEVKPGVFLPMFMNFKSTWSQPEVRKEFTRELVELIGDDVDWIIGLESGGSYFATAVANELGKPVSLMRKEDKQYGDHNFLVGETPPAGARVALIDDVYATGQSAIRAVAKLKEIGADPKLFAIFSYSADTEMKARLGAEGTALTYFKALRRYALDGGFITPDQADLLTTQVDTYRKTIYE